MTLEEMEVLQLVLEQFLLMITSSPNGQQLLQVVIVKYAGLKVFMRMMFGWACWNWSWLSGRYKYEIACGR